MPSRKELHLRVQGIDRLGVPGRPFDSYDSYVVASIGHVRHRTRPVLDTASPSWNEEFVIDAGALEGLPHEPVVKFEIYSQGLLADELLFFTYLPLDDLGPRGGTIGEEEEEGEEEGHGGGSSSSLGSGDLGDGGAAAATAAARRGPRAAPPRRLEAASTSAVSTQALALLPAGGSGSDALRPAVLGGRNMARSRLKRSTHVRSCGELTVASWWVVQPHADTRAAPLTVSFLREPGCQQLPWVAHSELASLWEEPPLAFVRLVVSAVRLGAAAAVGGAGKGAGKGEAGAGSSSGSDDDEGEGEGAAARVSPTAHAKATLRRIRRLLQGDAAAAAELEEQQQQQGAAAAGRPTLASIHAPAGIQPLLRGDGVAAAEWQAWGLSDEEEEEDDDDDASSLDDAGSLAASSCTLDSPRSGASRGAGRLRCRRRREGRGGALHLTVRVSMGGQPAKALRPVPVKPDGSADVCQSAVFAAARPLREAQLSYELGLGLGPRGPPVLSFTVQYSLLHLLRRSPPRPITWEAWREVTRCTVAGLQVPLPCLPGGAGLCLSAFLADADCRAGFYGVAPVADAALAAAAAEDEAAAEAAQRAEAEAAEGSEYEPLTDSEEDEGEARGGQGPGAPASRGLARRDAAPGAHADQRGGGGGGAGVLRRRTAPTSSGGDGQADGGGRRSQRPPAFEHLRGRVMGHVEAGLDKALDRLPPTVAQQVKGNRLLGRLFPQAQRAEVFSLGHLRVLSRKASGRQLAADSGGGGPQQQQQQQQQPPAGAQGAAPALAPAVAPPLAEHPNLATAGGALSRPLAVLSLTLQAVNLRRSSSSWSSGSLQLLLRCGPHWLQLQQRSLPLSWYGGSGGGGDDAGAARGAAPVRVLLPVYGSGCTVALVVHKRGAVVGRCVLKLYSLLPLLLREHTKTLTLFSDKRGSSGQRVVAGSALVALAAAPPPSYGWPAALLRLSLSYLVTPHTLEMHTSGVLRSLGRDARDDAAGALVAGWLEEAGSGPHAVPRALVDQLVSSGRGRLSAARIRGHVSRFKAVAVDWLPRRLDPLAFYHWRRPLHNVVAMWLLGGACLYPDRCLLAAAALFTVVLLRRIAIQIRRGVLGFELEQLPPEAAEAAGSAAGAAAAAPPQAGGEAAAGARVHWGGDAADRLRARLSAGKQKLAAAGQRPGGDRPPPPPLPTSLEELREQLESGELSLDAVDLDAAARQLLSVGGLLRLARQHSAYALDYALVAQNMLDDAAGLAEKFFAMATAQDPLAALVFCGILLSSALFCARFGVGAGVYAVLLVLLRPPWLRGIPGVLGWKALLANLPSRSVEELAW